MLQNQTLSAVKGEKTCVICIFTDSIADAQAGTALSEGAGDERERQGDSGQDEADGNPASIGKSGKA